MELGSVELLPHSRGKFANNDAEYHRQKDERGEELVEKAELRKRLLGYSVNLCVLDGLCK